MNWHPYRRRLVPPNEGVGEVSMQQSNYVKTRRGGASALKLTLAVSWRLMMAAAPLNAAEQPSYLQQPTPFETARKFESLTQGGLFDPNQIDPFESRRFSQSAADDFRDGTVDGQP